MCGRFTLAERLEQLNKRFEIEYISAKYKPSYNIAPTDNIITITSFKSEKKLSSFKWGIPVGEKLIINARSDKIESNAYYREGILNNRCLIPASGFYEWAKSGSRKVPYYIKSRIEKVISFAGFYQRVNDISCVTIITTDANDLVSKIHSRMPVILLRKNEQMWLNEETRFKDALNLLRPYPNDLTESYVVSSKVNNIRNNSPDLLRPKSKLSNFF
jgi:putative SOS response-associated peptidase YedK